MTRLYSLLGLALLVAPVAANAQVRDSTLRITHTLSPPAVAAIDTFGANDTPWGGQPPDAGITGVLVYVDDGLGGRLACEPIANAGDVAGNIALVARGVCNFSLKAYHAQIAGATAVIIHNHDDTPTDGPFTIYTMSGGDSASAVTITAAFAHRDWRDRVVPVVESGTDVTVRIDPAFVVAIEPGPITESTVHRARPNPFSTSTEFGVQLLRTQNVRVEVFNAIGQRVALLHDGPLAAGADVHEFTLEASSLPSGVYLYRVTGEDFVQTNSVILSR
jgi:hypothetical protein